MLTAIHELTNASTSSEANTSAHNHVPVTPRDLCNPKVHYSMLKSPPFCTILSHMNEGYLLASNG